MVTDQQLRALIEKHRLNLIMDRHRVFYEDEWIERVVDEEGVLALLKEALLLDAKNEDKPSV